MKGHLPGESMSDTVKRNDFPTSPFAIHARDEAQSRIGQAVADCGVAAEQQQLGMAGLGTILEQVGVIVRNRVNASDIEVLNFSLLHLFSRIDCLYRATLPELLSVSAAPISEKSRLDDLLRHQHIWTKLRSIQHTLSRVEPLCHLLDDATECILDVLDRTSDTNSTRRQVASGGADTDKDWLDALHSERLEQAMTAVMESLSAWQADYNTLTLLVDHFSHVVSAIPELIQLDEMFTILLDCAGAMFGDILPGFQAISVGDDDAVATLLFDLMHQSDQLLAQCDAALEPLQALIAQFALQSNR